MPGQDGTGPQGQGSRIGRGGNMARSSQGSVEPDKCECPKCGETIAHDRNLPCTSMVCPKCGTPMLGVSCR